jgi:hypothetical protein
VAASTSNAGEADLAARVDVCSSITTTLRWQ